MNELKPRIHDEGNDLDYILVGDYYIPAIEFSESDVDPIVKWGRMRRAYLQENNTLLYNHLILTGKLFPHLWEIYPCGHRQDTATSRMEQMMNDLLKANPAPDKKTNQMAWGERVPVAHKLRTDRADRRDRHMNALRAVAEETICAELITC